MNVNQIVDFLNHRRGYLKEGKRRLQQVLAKQGFKVSLNDCAEALSIVRSQIKNAKEERKITGDNPNFTDLPKNMKVKKAWQRADGTLLYSYEVAKTESGFDSFKSDLINDIKNLSKPSSKSYNNQISKDNEYVLEISLPDLHFGKGNMEELKTIFFESLINLTEKCANLPLSKIILPIGNDGLNSEGMRKTTTKGTPQEDSAPWFDTFRVYANTLIEAIEYLKTIAPVEVIVVQGNHDYERMFYIGEVIDAFYCKDARVNINNDVNPRKFIQFGSVLIMYTHGDNEKHSELPIIMATEAPMEFAISKHRETHCGHFHKEMVIDEQRGIKTRFLPSICAPDEWHKKMGYDAYRTAQAYLWHTDRGLEAILQHNI